MWILKKLANYIIMDSFYSSLCEIKTCVKRRLSNELGIG